MKTLLVIILALLLISCAQCETDSECYTQHQHEMY